MYNVFGSVCDVILVSGSPPAPLSSVCYPHCQPFAVIESPGVRSLRISHWLSAALRGLVKCSVPPHAGLDVQINAAINFTLKFCQYPACGGGGDIRWLQVQYLGGVSDCRPLWAHPGIWR